MSALPWDDLFRLAVNQRGYVRAAQAAELGFSPATMAHWTKRGRFERTFRGVYRVSWLPPNDYEDFIAAVTWEPEAVIGADSALRFHQLSDVLPSQIHVWLPPDKRRRRAPELISTFGGDLAPEEIIQQPGFRVTTPRRSLEDAAATGLPVELLIQATEEGLERGLFDLDDLPKTLAALEPFGSRERFQERA